MKGIYVDTSKRDAAFLIQYHSDQPGNLLTVPGMQEILHAMEQCRADEEAKVLLFTGSGDFFCMGGFLGDCADKGSEEILRFADTLTALHRRMNRFPKPTVAVVNGHVGGGGLSFLETFDFAVSVPEAEYSLPEIKRLGANAFHSERQEPLQQEAVYGDGRAGNAAERRTGIIFGPDQSDRGAEYGGNG